MKKQRFLGRRSPTSKVIHFPSVKCNELKFCESRLEYDCLLKLEFDSTVKYYEAQPEPIEYTRDNGKVVRYTPDLRVVLFDGSYSIQEVKPYKISIRPHILRKHALIASVYDDEGIPFKVVTEKDIRRGKSSENHLKLYRYLSEPIPNDAKKTLRDELSSFSGSLKELSDEMAQRGFAPYITRLLIAHGLVQFNFEDELNQATEVTCYEKAI